MLSPEFVTISIDLLFFLFAVAIVAGCVDTLAGGGGLLTLPALILAGIPPLAALGTNKLQGCMGTATATFLMFRKGKVSRIEARPLMFSAFIGSVLGSIVVQFINTNVLSFVIPLVLLFIAVYFLVSPVPHKSRAARVTDSAYKTFIVPSIGFYDGMFGPGTGSFFALAGVSCRGKGLIDSTAIAKTLNFSTNFASLLVFLAAGHIVWFAGILMMSGQAIGAWLGSHVLFKINPSYLRVIVVLMCVAMLVKYVYSIGWTA